MFSLHGFDLSTDIKPNLNFDHKKFIENLALCTLWCYNIGVELVVVRKVKELNMKRLPFFIEVWESGHNADLRICHKVMTRLFKQKILPLPFATTIHEVADVTNTLKRQRMEPAIFIVNTFWAEEVLRELDPFMGETPALFFRRDLYSFTKGLTAVFGEDPRRGLTTECIRNMTPREASIWSYGAKTTDSVAERAAQAVAKFLEDGKFMTIEQMNPTPATTFAG